MQILPRSLERESLSFSSPVGSQSQRPTGPCSCHTLPMLKLQKDLAQSLKPENLEATGMAPKHSPFIPGVGKLL